MSNCGHNGEWFRDFVLRGKKKNPQISVPPHNKSMKTKKKKPKVGHQATGERGAGNQSSALVVGGEAQLQEKHVGF